MTSNYFGAYRSLPHRVRFASFASDEIASSVEKGISGDSWRGRRVFLSDADPFRFALTFLRLIDLGAIPVPLAPSSADAPAELRMDSPVETSEPEYICQSSGTTGNPKQIRLSVGGALENARAHANAFGLGPQNVIAQVLPIYHSYGLVAFVWAPLVCGAAVDFFPGVAGLRAFDRKGESYVLHASPSQARFFLKDRFDRPAGLEKITIGGGVMSEGELELLQAKFPEIAFYVSYGLTEAGPRVTTGLFQSGRVPSAERSGSWIGSAIPGVELRVKRGESLEEQGEGILCVRTPSLCLAPDPQEMFQGWLVTRDRVLIDNGTENREVYFLSRSGDIIKCGGVSLYPSQIEERLRELPGVRDCVVLKIQDPVYEEVPIVFFESDRPAEDLHREVLAIYSPGIAPREIRAFSTLPRHSLNKIDRAALMRLREET
jgi:acyl-CoA synthetase (AMP-forming)/AMP-acid ligase II